MSPASPSPAAPRPRHGSWWIWLIVFAAGAATIVFGRRAAAAIPAFVTWVDGFGAWGPLVFVAGYALAVVAFVPGSLLTLAAGAVFGLAAGTLYVMVGATLGAALAFGVARHVARPWVARRVAASPRFAAIDRAIAGQGLRIVFLLRLSPVFPFNGLNYALGLTRVRFVDYLAASIGMLPGTLLYVYYGRLAGEAARLAGGMRPERGAGYYAVLVLGGVATLAVATIVARHARRALREATTDGSEPRDETERRAS